VFDGSSGKCSSASQQRKKKEKKQRLKEPIDKWTYTRMRPPGCSSIPPPRFPHPPPPLRMTLPIPNGLQARTTGKIARPSPQTQVEPLQSLETLICTTLVWETYLVSTACSAPMTRLSYVTPNGPDWVYPAPQTSSTSLTANSPFNYPNSFFLSSVPSSYNAMGYGSSSWSPQPGQVPLSTYSTLNGATSANSQTPSSQPSQTNIECVP
jgi:hypothetical protein